LENERLLRRRLRRRLQVLRVPPRLQPRAVGGVGREGLRGRRRRHERPDHRRAAALSGPQAAGPRDGA